MDESQLRAILRDNLPKSVSDKKIADLIEAIGNVWDFDGNITTVEVDGAHAPVQRIEAFGLHFDLDASGNAAVVHFPHGAHID